MTNPVLQAIAERRSNRAYKKDQITAEQVETLMNAAVQAPSARNAQPWHFTVVQDKSILSEINNEVSNNLNEDVGDIFYGAPTVIFISANTEGPTARWARLDCGIVAQTIALAAYSLDLGSVILGMPEPALAGARAKYFSRLLKFPEAYEFVIAVAIGNALDNKAAHPVRPDKIRYISG